MTDDQINIIENSWVDWTQFILITLFAPFFLFPSVKNMWIFFVIPLILILRWLIKKNLIERSVSDWAIFILAFQVFVSILSVPSHSISLSKAAGFLFGIFMFYSILAVLKHEKLIKAGAFLFLSGGFMFVFISIPGMMMYGEDWKYLNVLYKILALIPKINFHLAGAEQGFQPNAVGGTLLLILPVFIILGLYHIRKKKFANVFGNKPGKLNIYFWFFIWIGISILTVAILITRSRGSWIGLVLSLFFFLFVLGNKKTVRLIIIIFFAFFVVILNFDRMSSATEEIIFKINYRFNLWKLAVEKISERPVLGLGMDQFRHLPEVGTEASHSHNHLLHLAAELGLPALLAYLAILIGAGYMCFEVWRRGKVEWMRWFVMGLGCGQLAHLIFGIGDSIPLGGKPGIIFWISLALIASIYNYSFKPNQRNI
jgi:O-antigen ligase